ncbi:preprotein translocase subunit SecA [Candidatus Berkiella aquae]|uniref:Preprotein translocase subunit SecA n=1 Tax=Candidatus Berkiella aquae TaxID=295108 RepID=A0A0Q9YYS1_9GAMM|nr:preprotein translocase subunit SecA [Candidatus Berkiella aquae]MCS5712649.1 hypothetical protein [Candidatus Berkiella aquae]
MSLDAPSQYTLNLKAISEADAISRFVQQAKESGSTQIVLENMGDLSPDLQTHLMNELENKLAQAISFKVVEHEERPLMQGEFQQRLVEIELRNKLLALYGIQKVEHENLWHALIAAHLYSDIHARGRYQLTKKMDTREKTQELAQLTGQLEGTWFRHLFSYLQKNGDSFAATSFPYRELTPGLMSMDPYHPVAQLKEMNRYLSQDGVYMPFKTISIEYTAFEGAGKDVDLVTETLKLVQNNMKEGSPIEKIAFYHIGRNDVAKDEQDAINDLLDKLLEKLQKDNTDNVSAKIITQFVFDGMNLSKEEKLKVKEIQNLIAVNVRNHHKLERAGHVKQEQRIAPARQVQQKAIDPNTIRACKRNPKEVLAGLDVEIQMQQQQEQQQQQQEQQQMQMMQSRQALLDELLQRKSGQGNFEEADKSQYLNLEQFIALYEKSNKVANMGGAYRGENSNILEKLWRNFTGSSESFPGKIGGITKAMAEILISYPDILSDGINQHNIPPGFVIKQNKDNPDELLIDYDPVRAKLDTRNVNDLQVKFLPKTAGARIDLQGDHRQFSLSEEDYKLLTDVYVHNSIDIRDRIISKLPPQYAAEYEKFKTRNQVALLVEYVKNRSIEDLEELLENIKTKGEDYLKEAAAKVTISDKDYTEFVDNLIAQSKLATFHQLLQQEDAALGPIITEQYSDLFKLFNSDRSIVGLTLIVHQEGAQGVKIFLDKLDAIRKNQGNEALQGFLKLFVNNDINSAVNLMKTEELVALDYIAGLSKGQYAWWESLLSQQAKYDENINLVDVAKGFKKFLDKLAEIDPALPLKLTEPCPIQNAKNMKAACDRIWFILNNAVDPKEQFDHLEGLPLGPLDAYAAMRDQEYFFVSQEMNLQAQSEFLGSEAFLSLDPNQQNRAPYSVNLSEFIYANRVGSDYEECRTQYYRLLAKQPFLDNYDKYLKVMGLVDQAYEKWKGNISEKAAKLLGQESAQVAVPDPRVALALIAYATSHKEAMGTIEPKAVDKLFSELAKIEAWKKLSKDATYQRLLSYLNLGGDPPKSPGVITAPTLSQLSSLVRFHHELGKDHPFNKPVKDLKSVDVESYLSLSGKHFFAVLDDVAKANEKGLAALSSQAIADSLKEISEYDDLKGEPQNELREILLKVVGKLSNAHYNDENRLKLLTQCSQFLKNDKDKAKLMQVMEVLSGIDVAHQSTTQLANIEQLMHVIDAAMQSPSDSPNELMRLISTQEGFDKCFFGNQPLSDFDPESIAAFLKENEAQIREQLGGYIVFEDADFTDPKHFIQKLKDFEDKIPAIILKPLLNQAFNMVKGSHEALIMQKLQQQFWAANDTLRKEESELFINRLLPINKPDDLTKMLALTDTLTARVDDIDKMITTLMSVKARSIDDYKKLLSTLNNFPGVSQIPIETLNEVIGQMNRFHKGKFPVEILTTIVENTQVKKGLVADWEVTKRWMLPLVREKSVNLKEVSGMIDLGLNLSAKNVSVDNIVKLNEFLIKQADTRKDFIEIFQAIEKDPQFANQYSQIISNTLKLFEYLDKQNNSRELKRDFINAFGKAPHLFAEAIKQISNSQLDDSSKAQLIIILSRRTEAFTDDELKQMRTQKEKASKAEQADIKQKEVKEITDLVAALSQKSPAFLQALAQFDPDIGFPKAEDIIAHQKDNIDDLIEKIVAQKQAAREKNLAKQFDTAEVSRILEGMQNLATNNGLSYAQRERLQHDFYFVNAIGHSHSVSTNPSDPQAKRAIIKDMSKQEIQQLLGYYQKLVRDPNVTEESKRQGRLIYLALLREVMYRTTGRVPFSTQILSVLNAMHQNGNNIAEIQTGQGKSLTSALFAGMLHLDGQTVDICTSNMQLAREGLAENKKFYEYLGVKFTAIDSSSRLDDYSEGGIHYSDVAQLSLFRSRSQIEGGREPTKASLVLDEADYTLLDDSTQYRYAVNLDDVGDPFYNPMEFAYALINEFIETDEFKNPNASSEDDTRNLRQYLIKHAKGAQKDLAKDPQMISNKQLDIWIDSAVAAKELYTQRDKRWVLSEETRFDEKISVARLIINDRISPDAQWSNGVQQFLHARINEDDAIKNGQKAKCTLDPEKSAVASSTSKNFLDYYNKKNGVVWGMTGTIGSIEEKNEHQEKFGFKLTGIPPHQMQKRIDREPILVETDEKHQKKIFDEVLKRLRQNDKMPTLIICKDAITSKALAKYIEEQLQKEKKVHPIALQLYNGIDNERVDFNGKTANRSSIANESEATSQAGMQGTITISTPMFGRGTDFKPRMKTKEGLEAAHPKGLFVVQSYLDSERTSRQIVGRGGRQGWEGESMTIISKESLLLDLASTDKNAAQINQKLLQDRMDDVRLYRNMTAKQQRLYSEGYGDVRNQFFSMMIEMLEKIPEFCGEKERLYNEEMQKPEGERNLDGLSIPEPTKMRKALLKDWEQFLNESDIAWKKQLNQSPKPSLEVALQGLTKQAMNEWNKLVTDPNHRQLGDYQLSKEAGERIVANVLTRPDKVAKEAVVESYRKLPLAINIHKAYCDNLNLVDTPDIHSLKTAYHSEMDSMYQRLKEIVSHEKPKSVKLTSDWEKTTDYNAKYRLLNELLLKAQTNSRKEHSHQELTQLMTQTVAIINWMEKYPSLESDVKQLKQMLLQAHVNYRKELDRTSPFKLLQHDREMQVYSAKGYYPTSHSYNQLMKRDLSAWHNIKNNSLSQLKEYKKSALTSKARDRQVDEIIKYLNNSQTYDAQGLYKQLFEARKQAYQDDAKMSIKKRLFKNKINFGNRFHKMIDDIQARVVANTNSLQELEAIHKLEIQDIRLLLQAVNAKYNNPGMNDLVNNVKVQLGHGDTQAALKSLEALKFELKDDSRLSKNLQDKMLSLDEIHLREQRLHLLAESAKSTLNNEPSPIVTPWVKGVIPKEHETVSPPETTVSEAIVIPETTVIPDASQTDLFSFLDDLLLPETPREKLSENGVLKAKTELNTDNFPPLPPIPTNTVLPQQPSDSSQSMKGKPQALVDLLVSKIDQAKKGDVKVDFHFENMKRLLISIDKRSSVKGNNEQQRHLQIHEMLESYSKDTKVHSDVRTLAQALIKDVQQHSRKSFIQSFHDPYRSAKKENMSPIEPQESVRPKSGPKQ